MKPASRMKSEDGNEERQRGFRFAGYRLEQESMLETFKSLGVVPKRNIDKFRPFLHVLNASIASMWTNVSVKALLKESSVSALQEVMQNTTRSASWQTNAGDKISLRESSISALKDLMQSSAAAPSTAFARLKTRNYSNSSSIRMGVLSNFSADMWRTASNWTKLRRNEQVFIRSIEELDHQLKEGASIYRLKIQGRSQPWRQNEQGILEPSLRSVGPRKVQPHQVHPVIQAIRTRQDERSRPGKRSDSLKIGLAIEGGGLRGSVTAGMACAINDLGVADAFDLVLGSSAGSIVGSYLVARADHRTTYQFFCNYLTTSKNHLNGTSWLDISRLTKLLSPIRPDFSPKSPVMLLEYPMKHIMQELLPLNWTVFERNNKHQPMKVIASGLFSQGPVILGTEEDSFNDLSSLCDCIKASCMLPGIAGIQPIWIKGSSSRDPENLKQGCELWIDYELSRSLWNRAQAAFVNQLSSRSSSSSSSQEEEEVGLSRDEFIQVMRAIGVHAGSSDLLELFHMVDVNQDGFIEEEELKNVLVWIVWKQLINIREVSDSLASFVPEVEPLVDALVYEPIPYRSALSSGCSHVLVLRSYPDGNLMPKSLLGIFERLIAPKCLDPFPKVKKHLHDAGHSIIYAKDILLLNQQASKGLVSNQAADEGRQEEETDPRLFAIAPLDVDDVISQLALDRNVLLAGILQGFVRAYDILGDPSRSLTGAERAIDLFLPLHFRFLMQIGEAEKSSVGTGRDVRALLPVECWNAMTERVGRGIPASWSIGIHFFLSDGSSFRRGEEVVVARGDGRRMFGTVMGWDEEEARYIVATAADKVKNSNSFSVRYTMCRAGELGKIEQSS